MPLLQSVSFGKTKTDDNAGKFLEPGAELWIYDGFLVCKLNAIVIAQDPDQSFDLKFNPEDVAGVRGYALHGVVFKNATAGSNGRLAFNGVVTDVPPEKWRAVGFI